MLDLRPRGAPAWGREHIRPHVEHGQQVVTPVGIRDGNDDGLFGKGSPCDRIESVEVWAHDHLIGSGGIRRNVVEGVWRPKAKFLACRHIDHLPAREVHRHERVEVEIGIDADRMRLLLGYWRGLRTSRSQLTDKSAERHYRGNGACYGLFPEARFQSHDSFLHTIEVAQLTQLRERF